MNKATAKRWGWVVLVYAVVSAILYFVMKSMYEMIGITPDGYQDYTWWMALQNLLINTVAMSLALFTLWNGLYSYRVLGGGRKGGGVYVLLLLFAVVHIAVSIALLYYTVLHILSALSGNPLTLFISLLTEWSLSYGADFLSIHFLPALTVLPFLTCVLLFGPECIAHKFFANPLRSKLGLKYSNI